MAAAVCIFALLLLGCGAFTSADPLKDCKYYATINKQFTVPLNLPFKDDRLRWQHNSTYIYDSKHQTHTVTVTENGSLTLTSVKNEDAGIYTSEILNAGGSLRNSKTVKLCVLESVQKPKVTFRCDASFKKVEFTCTVVHSQTKDVSFQWLAGDTKVANAHNKILQRNSQQLASNSFRCIVSNPASSETSDPVKQDCLKSVSPDTGTKTDDDTLFGVDFWLMVGILAGGGGLVLVLMVATIVCCSINRKKRRLQEKEEEELRLQWSNSNQQQEHQHMHMHRPHQHHTHRPNQTQAPTAAGHTGPRPQHSRQNRHRHPDPITGQPLPSPRRQTPAPSAAEKEDDEIPPPLPQPRKKAPRTQKV